MIETRIQTNRRAHCWAFFIIVTVLALISPRVALAQSVDIDRVAMELEPEIRRAMADGKIPSATVALIAGDQVIWTGAYGNSNLWARTAATKDTVYLIGSTFKAMSTVALLQQMEKVQQFGSRPGRCRRSVTTPRAGRCRWSCPTDPWSSWAPPTASPGGRTWSACSWEAKGCSGSSPPSPPRDGLRCRDPCVRA